MKTWELGIFLLKETKVIRKYYKLNYLIDLPEIKELLLISYPFFNPSVHLNPLLTKYPYTLGLYKDNFLISILAGH